MLPAVLTPFVRSDALGAILAELFLRPDEELSISELARRADVSVPLAHKEVARLVDAGVLVDRREGNSRLVRAGTAHPLFAPMAEIVAASYGPVPVLRELLAGVPGVDLAFVYGSWAARRTGRPGKFPRDVDVLVVGTASRAALADVAGSARRSLDMEVNIHRVDAASWAQPEGNAFLETVLSRPRVALTASEGAGG